MNPVQSQFDYMKREYGIDALVNGGKVRVLIEEIEDFKSSDMKSIFMSTGLASQGDCISIDGVTWMLTQQDETPRDVYDKFTMKRVNQTTKFIVNESLYEADTIYSVGAQSLDENKYMSLPDGKMKLIVSENETSKQIKLNDRLIKWGMAWKVTAVTNEYKGLLCVYAEKDSIADGDDLVNEIPKGLPVWSVSIQDDTRELTEDKTDILTAMVTKNDLMVTEGFELVYSTSDEAIVTVNSNGTITGNGVGSATVRASLKSDSSVFDEISINVIEEIILNVEYKIEPEMDKFLRQEDATLTISKMVNGESQAETFTVTVEPSTTVPQDKYEFDVIDGNNIKIKNLGYTGQFDLKIVPLTSPDDTYVKSYKFTNSYW